MARRLALCGALILIGALGVMPARARASGDQVAMIQDGRVETDPADVAAVFRELGAQQVRVFMLWSYLAPRSGSHHRPSHFAAGNPAAYAGSAWAPWDRTIEAIQTEGMRVNLDVAGGAPLWATGPGAPTAQPHPDWEPNPADYQAFVHAVGERYSGDYDPRTHRLDPGNPDDLPRVDFWSIWNEPNYGPSLAPQGVIGDLAVDHAPEMYRQLVDAGWSALTQTGHRRDTILFGELAPRGYPPTGPIHFGVFSGMKPLPFLRSMYCLDRRYRPLLGADAAIRGCPTTAAGRRAFTARNPALFAASGVAVHPYSRWFAPNRETPNDPDYASLADIGQLTGALDRIQRAYGSHLRFPIWNTEYGYQTDPPKHDSARFPWVSAATAAAYLNQAEYVSWKNPRIESYMQYQLWDPAGRPSAANGWGGFASGLIDWDGRAKPAYEAWRLPVWLPVSTGRPGARLEVWGCARPAYFALRSVLDAEPVAIEFRRRGSAVWNTLSTVDVTDPRGYFDTRVSVPASGVLRLRWSYPADDPSLGAGTTVSSRVVAVTLGAATRDTPR